MKNVFVSLALILCAAVQTFSQPAAAVAGITNVPARRGGRGPGNSNDVFYRLGPDSKPMDGVPKGRFAGAKIRLKSPSLIRFLPNCFAKSLQAQTLKEPRPPKNVFSVRLRMAQRRNCVRNGSYTLNLNCVACSKRRTRQ